MKCLLFVIYFTLFLSENNVEMIIMLMNLYQQFIKINLGELNTRTMITALNYRETQGEEFSTVPYGEVFDFFFISLPFHPQLLTYSIFSHSPLFPFPFNSAQKKERNGILGIRQVTTIDVSLTLQGSESNRIAL